MTPRLVIAGSASNVGKTTVMTGLLAAVRTRGLRVQPFKAGPDYIDPTYHTLAAGQPGRNLDSWLVPHARLVAGFERATANADLAAIEGVMGLFDGLGYDGEVGSTAEIAKLLGAPVVVVLDVRAQARSAAATAVGFQRFDPAVRVVGFICNRVGSESHYLGVKGAIEAATGLPVLGGLPRVDELTIPERHLGLTPTGELDALEPLIAGLGELVERHCDIDHLLALARAAAPPARDDNRASFPAGNGPGALNGAAATYGARVGLAATARSGMEEPVIAVARDHAFSFYYEDNLDLLRHCGARIVEFSPLADAGLPPGTSAVYLGGGFPELYAAELAANRNMRESLAAAVRAGLPCYAECGGLMYLAGGLLDLDGHAHPMVAVLPGVAVMQPRRAKLGYAIVRARRDTLLLRAGEEARGHEFHYSTWRGEPTEEQMAYDLTSPRGGVSRRDGFASGKLLASYVHLHFGHNPELARRFVEAAADFRDSRVTANVVTTGRGGDRG